MKGVFIICQILLINIALKQRILIEALRDAKISALTEISALEMAQGATNWAPFSAASDSTLYRLLGQYELGLRLHCIAKIGEKAFDEEMKKMQEK